MNLQALRELGKELNIKKAHVKGAETLVKEINEIHKIEGLELVEFSDTQTIDGIEIPQNVDPAIAAAIVSTKLSKKIDREREEADSNKKKTQNKLSYADKAKRAAQQALRNPNINAYIYEKNSTELANKSRKRATRKKRVLVTVLDPSRLVKAGEVFKVRNSQSGSITELVMYNEHPQHLSEIIVNALREITFNKFVADDRFGNKMKTKKQMATPAFRIQELPHLTKEELEELKKKQSQRATRIEG